MGGGPLSQAHFQVIQSFVSAYYNKIKPSGFTQLWLRFSLDTISTWLGLRKDCGLGMIVVMVKKNRPISYIFIRKNI